MSTSESTAVGSFGDTPNFGPTRSEDFLGTLHSGSRSSYARRLSTSSVPNGVASREDVDGVLVTNIFVDNLSRVAAGVGRSLVHERSEVRAVSDVTGGVGTLGSVDELLQSLKTGVGPSVLEITVETTTSGITVGEDPSTRTIVGELINGDEHLVEDGDKMNGMGVRTVTAVEVLDGISHVRLVVSTIEVLSVPT